MLPRLPLMIEKEVGGFDEACNTAAIEPPTMESVSDYLSVCRLDLQRIDELHFAILAGRGAPQDVEDIGGRI